MEQPEITVIVAIYNAEKYLRRCLESIRNQTFEDFEVLMIDDGSQDHSGIICDEYEMTDIRFKAIHKSNGGVASARQCGNDNATGTFIIHIDPDDWIEPHMLDEMYCQIEKEDADICCCKIIKEFENSSRKIDFYEYNIAKNSGEILRFLHLYSNSLCNKLIRHRLYDRTNLKFNEELKSGEDAYMLVNMLMANPKVTSVNKYFYHYDQFSNKCSLTKNYTCDTLKNDIHYINLIDKLNHTHSILQYKRHLIGEVAHKAFYYNLVGQHDYTRSFGKYIFTILSSSLPIRRKVNIFLSILGLKNITQKLYIKLKSLYLNE